MIKHNCITILVTQLIDLYITNVLRNVLFGAINELIFVRPFERFLNTFVMPQKIAVIVKDLKVSNASIQSQVMTHK